jgi:hypothetical protein
LGFPGFLRVNTTSPQASEDPTHQRPSPRRANAKGFAISVADGQIAAIAAVHGFAVATRDAAPFLAAGVTVINPWES